MRRVAAKKSIRAAANRSPSSLQLAAPRNVSPWESLCEWRERGQLHAEKPAPTKMDRPREGAAMVSGQDWCGWPVVIAAARLGEVCAAAASRERGRRERREEAAKTHLSRENMGCGEKGGGLHSQTMFHFGLHICSYRKSHVVG